MPTIITMLILRIGSLMSIGYEKTILLYNPSTYDTADIISSYVYRVGLLEQGWSYSTAIGLFNSVINLILLVLANKLSKSWPIQAFGKGDPPCRIQNHEDQNVHRRKDLLRHQLYFLALVAVACLYPMLYVLFASFSNSNQLMRHTGILLWPQGFSAGAYEWCSKPDDSARLPEYDVRACHEFDFADHADLAGCVLSLPPQCHVPEAHHAAHHLYDVLLRRHDTHLLEYEEPAPDWKPVGFDPAVHDQRVQSDYSETSFASIPESLIEAARIDGASHLKVLFSIVLPLSKAILAVMVLYYGVGVWNGWFWASAILRDREMYPLQLVLREILLQNSTSNMTGGTSVGDVESVAATVKYATIMVATVPILCIYPFLQKYFAAGVMVGAVKE